MPRIYTHKNTPLYSPIFRGHKNQALFSGIYSPLQKGALSWAFPMQAKNFPKISQKKFFKKFKKNFSKKLHENFVGFLRQNYL